MQWIIVDVGCSIQRILGGDLPKNPTDNSANYSTQIIADLSELHKWNSNEFFILILLNSVDTTCVHKRYEENNIQSFMWVKKPLERQPRGIEAAILYDIITLCSMKIDAVLEFLFETLWSFNALA
jgi:hypothetical protein